MRDSRNNIKVVGVVEGNPYPYDIRARLNSTALAEHGYDVTVVAPRAKAQARCEHLNGVKVYRYPLIGGGTNSLYYLGEFLLSTMILTVMVLWLWARHGLDVLHIYAPPDSLFICGLLPKFAGKVVIYDNRDLSPELYESKYQRRHDILWKTLRWLERRAARLASHVLMVNESYRQVIMARADLPADRVTSVRIGPELERIRIVDPDPGLRARGKTIIAYMGQMSSQDGVDHLLRALYYLDRNFGCKDWFCVLIGRSDDLASLQDLAEQLGISGRVWFTGFVPDVQMLSYLSTADICVDPDPANPLNEISTMIKLMEYLTLGKPVVAYGLTEHRVTAGDAALYAVPNDEVDLARQIGVLITNPILRERLGAKGRARVEEELAWQHQRERLLAVYASLVKQQQPSLRRAHSAGTR